MVTFLMMSAKMATLSLLKIKVLKKVTISVHDVTNKILLRKSFYVVDVVI